MASRLVDLSEFLDKKVEVVTGDSCVKGILKKVENNSRHDGHGNILLEDNDGLILVRGSMVIAIRSFRR